MKARPRFARAALVAAGLAVLISACVSLRARDLRDIGLPQVECSARDESARCACWSKCVSEESDCRCVEE